ncbi:MAG: HD-like signal output (HDOD) protein [Desulforhopalus sp.]|jgi:HD-like signal output (HDOD) protein
MLYKNCITFSEEVTYLNRSKEPLFINPMIRKERAIAIIHEFLQSGGDLPFSAEVRPQLLSISSDPVETIDVEKFVNLIQLDPGLATNVLQLANSVYFSSATKIVSLRRAIVQIGLEEAINFIQVVLFRSSLPKFPEIAGGFSDKDYWSHSWACAIACKSLGHPTIGTNLLPGELYIAGLLHGIGKLVLAIHRPNEFLQCLENSVEFQLTMAESQLDIFGTTDADIACELLKVWQLPDNVSIAIKYFQNPAEAEKEHQEFAGLLQLAYFIANTSGVGNINDEYCYNVNETWISQQVTSPLYDKKLRERFIKNIYIVLEKKQTSLEAIGGEEADGPPKELGEQIYTKKLVVNESWLSRLCRWFKAYLG